MYAQKSNTPRRHNNVLQLCALLRELRASQIGNLAAARRIDKRLQPCAQSTNKKSDFTNQTKARTNSRPKLHQSTDKTHIPC